MEQQTRFNVGYVIFALVAMLLLLLVLVPVPYVDASSAWGFRDKGKRMVVGAAGIAVELFLGALALFVWLSVESGAVRAVAYNVMLISGVSTLLFNGNPLLRFDGYYMLMDYLEIPNLRQRATQYLVYLCERYLFGKRDVDPPNASAGERAWFVGFSVTSFLYRIVVIIAILLFLGEQSLLLGLIFAGSTAFAWLVLPAMKIGNYLANSPRIRRVRYRAVTTAGFLLGGLVVLFAAVPIPLRTLTEGVVWVPEEGIVRAGADGFVARVVATPGTWVKPGDVLVQCQDLDLSTEASVLEGQLRELDARHRQAVVDNRVQAELIDEQRKVVTENLARARERMQQLTIRAQIVGLFVMPKASDLLGRFVQRGQTLGHVVDVDNVTVRTLVSQEQIDLVRQDTRAVEVRLAERFGTIAHATMQRVVPGASNELPSPALGTHGGGVLPVDPTDAEGRKSVQNYFQVDVQLAGEKRPVNMGGRAYVRFDHGWEPLAVQWYREARQLFLSRLNV